MKIKRKLNKSVQVGTLNTTDTFLFNDKVFIVTEPVSYDTNYAKNSVFALLLQDEKGINNARIELFHESKLVTPVDCTIEITQKTT